MPSLDRLPAVRRLDVDRRDVLAIEIAGEITGFDAENLFGLLEAAYAVNGTIDMLVRWPDGEEVEWSDISAETAAEARSHARGAIRRCAAIGGSGDISALLRRFGLDSAAEFRRFDAGDEAAAWQWIGARPDPA